MKNLPCYVNQTYVLCGFFDVVMSRIIRYGFFYYTK